MKKYKKAKIKNKGCLRETVCDSVFFQEDANER